MRFPTLMKKVAAIRYRLLVRAFLGCDFESKIQRISTGPSLYVLAERPWYLTPPTTMAFQHAVYGKFEREDNGPEG